jgi:endonuclease/exonuclease/phosphatase (EEP) superfamily protein YafD
MPIASAGYMPDANYLITPPKNIIMGVQRQIMVETTRDIRTQQFIVVMSLRIDFVFEEEDAVVKATGLVAA